MNRIIAQEKDGMDLNILEIIERFIALMAVVGTIVFTVTTIIKFIGADWSQVATFHSFLEHLLNIAIGVEAARLLVDYSFETLVELLAFVVARKIILVEGDFLAVLIGIVAIAVLFGARHYFPRTFKGTSRISPTTGNNDGEEKSDSAN